MHPDLNRSLRSARQLPFTALTPVVLLTAQLILAGSPRAMAGDPIQALRERFLGPNGLPSPDAYERALGIAPIPGSERFDWRVMFKITYREADLDRLDDAQAVATDCYFIRGARYAAPYRARAVWDGRVYLKQNQLVVGAYTSRREQLVGRVTADGLRMDPQLDEHANPFLALEDLRYNPFTGQLWSRESGGQISEEQAFFLPAPLIDAHGEMVRPKYEIVDRGGRRFELVARCGSHQVALAQCVVDPDQVNGRSTGYLPGLGEGCSMVTEEPTIVLELRGDFVPDAVDFQGAQLVLKEAFPICKPPKSHVQIDGRFDDWRSVPGIADPRGDIASYLQYNPDTDLLEFKVASDDKHLYFYSRVAGRHGNSAAGDDRYYYYVYIDADRDPTTGYVPTRDDDCYYGVAIGDDCESQFEFVGGRFIKTFFGFTGAATEEDVLSGKVTIAPSWYSKYDELGRLREGYKVEYVRQGDRLKITEDYTEGTSDDIIIAISADGSECEMRAELKGFLESSQGEPLISLGQRIDLAVGVEASGKIHGNTKWGADSTAVIRGFLIAE